MSLRHNTAAEKISSSNIDNSFVNEFDNNLTFNANDNRHISTDLQYEEHNPLHIFNSQPVYAKPYSNTDKWSIHVKETSNSDINATNKKLVLPQEHKSLLHQRNAHTLTSATTPISLQRQQYLEQQQREQQWYSKNQYRNVAERNKMLHFEKIVDNNYSACNEDHNNKTEFDTSTNNLNYDQNKENSHDMRFSRMGQTKAFSTVPIAFTSKCNQGHVKCELENMWNSSEEFDNNNTSTEERSSFLSAHSSPRNSTEVLRPNCEHKYNGPNEKYVTYISYCEKNDYINKQKKFASYPRNESFLNSNCNSSTIARFAALHKEADVIEEKRNTTQNVIDNSTKQELFDRDEFYKFILGNTVEITNSNRMYVERVLSKVREVCTKQHNENSKLANDEEYFVRIHELENRIIKLMQSTSPDTFRTINNFVQLDTVNVQSKITTSNNTNVQAFEDILQEILFLVNEIYNIHDELCILEVKHTELIQEYVLEEYKVKHVENNKTQHINKKETTEDEQESWQLTNLEEKMMSELLQRRKVLTEMLMSELMLQRHAFASGLQMSDRLSINLFMLNEREHMSKNIVLGDNNNNKDNGSNKHSTLLSPLGSRATAAEDMCKHYKHSLNSPSSFSSFSSSSTSHTTHKSNCKIERLTNDLVRISENGNEADGVCLFLVRVSAALASRFEREEQSSFKYNKKKKYNINRSMRNDNNSCANKLTDEENSNIKNTTANLPIHQCNFTFANSRTRCTQEIPRNNKQEREEHEEEEEWEEVEGEYNEEEEEEEQQQRAKNKRTMKRSRKSKLLTKELCEEVEVGATNLDANIENNNSAYVMDDNSERNVCSSVIVITSPARYGLVKVHDEICEYLDKLINGFNRAKIETEQQWHKISACTNTQSDTTLHGICSRKLSAPSTENEERYYDECEEEEEEEEEYQKKTLRPHNNNYINSNNNNSYYQQLSQPRASPSSSSLSEQSSCLTKLATSKANTFTLPSSLHGSSLFLQHELNECKWTLERLERCIHQARDIMNKLKQLRRSMECCILQEAHERKLALETLHNYLSTDSSANSENVTKVVSEYSKYISTKNNNIINSNNIIGNENSEELMKGRMEHITSNNNVANNNMDDNNNNKNNDKEERGRNIEYSSCSNVNKSYNNNALRWSIISNENGSDAGTQLINFINNKSNCQNEASANIDNNSVSIKNDHIMDNYTEKHNENKIDTTIECKETEHLSERELPTTIIKATPEEEKLKRSTHSNSPELPPSHSSTVPYQRHSSTSLESNSSQVSHRTTNSLHYIRPHLPRATSIFQSILQRYYTKREESKEVENSDEGQIDSSDKEEKITTQNDEECKETQQEEKKELTLLEQEQQEESEGKEYDSQVEQEKEVLDDVTIVGEKGNRLCSSGKKSINCTKTHDNEKEYQIDDTMREDMSLIKDNNSVVYTHRNIYSDDDKNEVSDSDCNSNDDNNKEEMEGNVNNDVSLDGTPDAREESSECDDDNYLVKEEEEIQEYSLRNGNLLSGIGVLLKAVAKRALTFSSDSDSSSDENEDIRAYENSCDETSLEFAHKKRRLE